MDIGNLSLIVGGVCFLLIIGIALYIIQQRKIMQADYPGLQKRKDPLTMYGKFAVWTSKNDLTRRKYNQIRSEVSILCPSERVTMENITGEILLKAYFVSFLILALVGLMVLISGFDVFYIMAGCMAALVMFKQTTTAKVRKLENQLLKEEQRAFPIIHHKYHRRHMVDLAVRDAINECGDIIRPHLIEIYDILTAPDIKKRAEKYTFKKPDNNLLMFVSFCTAIADNGDRKLPDGQWLFVQQLTYLKQAVDAEVLARRQQELAFKGTTIMTLAPMILIKPFELWARTNIPQIAAYYDGIYSTVCIILTFIVTYLIYTVIDAMQDNQNNKIQTESLWTKISRLPGISDFLAIRVSNKYGKWSRIDSQLRGLGDHTGPKAFMVKQWGYAIAGFLLTLAVFVGGAYIGRSKILTDFSNDFKNSIAPTEEYKQTMAETAERYAQTYSSGELEEAELALELQQEGGYSAVLATEMAQAIISHQNEYANRYFKWWQLLVSLGVGLIGFMIPMALLKMNTPLIDAKRAEEVGAMQVLMLIVMGIPGTGIGQILEWMERFSTCFIESITQCHANLGAGEEKAILTMRDSENFPKFKEFCDCLLSVDDVGVEDAFDEIKTDHDYNRESQKIERLNDIQVKAGRAKFLSALPLYLVIGLYLMLPLVRYAVDMFASFEGVL